MQGKPQGNVLGDGPLREMIARQKALKTLAVQLLKEVGIGHVMREI